MSDKHPYNITTEIQTDLIKYLHEGWQHQTCIFKNTHLVKCLTSANVQNTGIRMLKNVLCLSNEMKTITREAHLRTNFAWSWYHYRFISVKSIQLIISGTLRYI